MVCRVRGESCGRWLLVLTLIGLFVSGTLAEAESATTETVLLGPLERSEIEMALPDWVGAQIDAEPDRHAALELADTLSGAEIVVFFGSWCSDSRRELARLWRALDEAGALDPQEVRYIGVDRSKREPAEWIGETTIVLVPTFVVRRAGEELGRVVETSPNGIEMDLAALLAGRRQGLITDSAEKLVAESDD